MDTWINWFSNLNVSEQAGVISAVIAVISLVVTLIQWWRKRAGSSQSVSGNNSKVAQVKGDNAKIDIR